MNRYLRLLTLFLCTLFLCTLFLCTLAAARAQDGIFADFNTSMGSFTCQLRYDLAPKTVANFMTLANGQRAWLDLPTGDAKRRPFYDGLTFHRVVANFVIQGGSPNGTGSDGPGYSFKDEFHPSLRHNKKGILSMANSGLNSNGSQFFVTLAATSHLDDVHSVFGEVTSGIAVVDAIGAVQTNTSTGKPLVNVTMNSVVIRRVGAAALAFNPLVQGLPTVESAAPTLVKNGANLSLAFTRSLNQEYAVYDSADLTTWTRQFVGLYTQTPPTGNFDVSATGNQTKHFYRVPKVSYPDTLFTPATLSSGTLTLNLTSGEKFVYVFAATGSTGTYTFTDAGGGSITGTTNYAWSQEAYRGRATIVPNNFYATQVSYVFANSGGGVFKGTAYDNVSQIPIAGTFTFTRP